MSIAAKARPEVPGQIFGRASRGDGVYTMKTK